MASNNRKSKQACCWLPQEGGALCRALVPCAAAKKRVAARLSRRQPAAAAGRMNGWSSSSSERAPVAGIVVVARYYSTRQTTKAIRKEPAPPHDRKSTYGCCFCRAFVVLLLDQPQRRDKATQKLLPAPSWCRFGSCLRPRFSPDFCTITPDSGKAGVALAVHSNYYSLVDEHSSVHFLLEKRGFAPESCVTSIIHEF